MRHMFISVPTTTNHFDEVEGDRRLSISDENFRVKIVLPVIDMVLFQLNLRFEGLRKVTENFDFLFPTSLIALSDNDLAEASMDFFQLYQSDISSDFTDNYYIVATSININSIPTSIASAYFPPGSPFPAEDLSLFLQTLNHTYIIGADFNAKHEAWGCRSKNPRGRALHNFITIKRSKVISPASPTYWPTHANRHPDYLDFFLSNLPNHIHINISNLNDPASDHTPIILKIQANVPFHPLVKKRTDWNKFRNIMSTSSSLNIKLKNSTDIDTAINTLTNNIQDSFEYLPPHLQLKTIPVEIPLRK
ncbi:hypothetical protein QTP88_011718 [Uroleucon formosanum]